jgi:glucosamine-6-phosphate deaminase
MPAKHDIVCADAAELAIQAAACLVADIIDLLRHKRQVQVVFSTGETPLQTYAALREHHRHALAWQRVTLYQMDEYCGLAAGDPRRFQAYLREQLVDPLGLTSHLLRGDETDAQMQQYEAALVQGGGLDVLLYGVGVNGHLGFNEPGTRFTAASRRVQLAPSTVAQIDPAPGPVPQTAVTLGLQVLNQARRIRVMALGAKKQAALTAGLLQPPDVAVPLSSLQACEQVRYYFDPAACPTDLRAQNKLIDSTHVK